MKRSALIILIIIFSYLQGLSVYPLSWQGTSDSVFVNNGVVVGKVVDIKHNRVVVKAGNGNTQVISLRQVRKVVFAGNFVPRVLLRETIIYQGKKLTGRVLYIDLLHSDVLFYQASTHSLIRLPLLETSLASRPVKKLYQSGFYFSVFFGLATLVETIISFFTNLNVYLIAASLLLLFTLVMFFIFGLPWLRHKKATRV